MGQQIRKVTKRRRRIEYLKRKKEQSKLNSNAPIRLAVPVAKDAKPAAKEAPAKKTAAKAPAKKTETKAAAAKKAPLKSRLPRRPLNPPPNNCPGGGCPSARQSNSCYKPPCDCMAVFCVYGLPEFFRSRRKRRCFSGNVRRAYPQAGALVRVSLFPGKAFSGIFMEKH